MRVISGSLKGRGLKVKSRGKIRPTSERVREAVFNILPRDLSDVRVLDLYAGVGAMGIEAISRGALSAVLVDSGRDAAKAIKDNLKELELGDKARLMSKKASAAIKLLNADKESFDLVFIDPPYQSGEGDRIMQLLSELDMLTPEAIIVVEHELAGRPGESYNRLVRYDCREYGNTAVSFYKRSDQVS